MARHIDYRKRIHYRIRKKVSGTAECPRVAVFRSLKHIYLQAIDDTAGKTIVSVSTVDKEMKGKTDGKRKSDLAGVLGETLGNKLKDKKIETIVFDRGGFRYQGRVKAAADGLRTAGIKF